MGKSIILDHNLGLRRYGELKREKGAIGCSCRERGDRNWRGKKGQFDVGVQEEGGKRRDLRSVCGIGRGIE